MPDEPYTVTARRDRANVVYYRQHDGSWKAPMFTRCLSLDELEQDFGPTVAVDVDNVEALLADHARLRSIITNGNESLSNANAEIRLLRRSLDLTEAQLAGAEHACGVLRDFIKADPGPIVQTEVTGTRFWSRLRKESDHA